MIYRKILFIFIFISIIIYTYSQDTNNQNNSDNKLTVGEIKFIGIKATKPEFLLSLIKIKKGSKWDENEKANLYNTLINEKRIIEKVTIHEELTDHNIVNLTIEIVEKASFILVPFFKYGNTNGFQPKIIFRHYNLAGYKKFLNIKSEFIPRTSFNIFIPFEHHEK